MTASTSRSPVSLAFVSSYDRTVRGVQPPRHLNAAARQKKAANRMPLEDMTHANVRRVAPPEFIPHILAGTGSCAKYADPKALRTTLGCGLVAFMAAILTTANDNVISNDGKLISRYDVIQACEELGHSVPHIPDDSAEQEDGDEEPESDNNNNMEAEPEADSEQEPATESVEI